jgi:2,4-dienoyl-CoA reductase-like NADH-dependent reductase (Old Yellow Enzyme family)
MTTAAADILFRPFRIGTLDLPNRIVMAPMTRSMAPAGVPGAPNAAYYRRRAEGGVGLILSEGTWWTAPPRATRPISRFFMARRCWPGGKA